MFIKITPLWYTLLYLSSEPEIIYKNCSSRSKSIKEMVSTILLDCNNECNIFFTVTYCVLHNYILVGFEYLNFLVSVIVFF